MEQISIKELNLEDAKIESGLSIIQECVINNENYMCKRYVDDNTFSRSFCKKIDNLSSISEEGLCVPKILITDNGKPTCYLAKKFEGKTIINLDQEKQSKKIKVLKNAKNKILKMQALGIIHADIHYANLMYDSDGNVGVIDFDNCSYKNYRTIRKLCFDYAEEFIRKFGTCEELDIAMFNYLTFSILNTSSNGFFRVRNDIYKKNYGEFYDEDSIKICDSLLLEDKKPNQEFLIDTIKI